MGTVSALRFHPAPPSYDLASEIFRVLQNRALIHSLLKTYAWHELALMPYANVHNSSVISSRSTRTLVAILTNSSIAHVSEEMRVTMTTASILRKTKRG